MLHAPCVRSAKNAETRLGPRAHALASRNPHAPMSGEAERELSCFPHPPELLAALWVSQVAFSRRTPLASPSRRPLSCTIKSASRRRPALAARAPPDWSAPAARVRPAARLAIASRSDWRHGPNARRLTSAPSVPPSFMAPAVIFEQRSPTPIQQGAFPLLNTQTGDSSPRGHGTVDRGCGS